MPSGLHKGRGGEAEKPRPRCEKFTKQRPVHLEHKLAAIEIGRCESRLLKQRFALALAKQTGRFDRVLHKAAAVLHKGGIETSFERDRPDPSHQQRRRGGNNREKPDNPDMQFRPGNARAARREKCISLGEDEKENEENAKNICDKEAENDGIRWRNRRVAGKNQKADEPDEEGEDDSHGPKTGRETGMAGFPPQIAALLFDHPWLPAEKDVKDQGTDYANEI